MDEGKGDSPRPLHVLASVSPRGGQQTETNVVTLRGSGEACYDVRSMIIAPDSKSIVERPKCTRVTKGTVNIADRQADWPAWPLTKTCLNDD